MFAKKVVESHSSESVGLENSNVNFRHQNALNQSSVPIAPWPFRIIGYPINNPSTIYTEELFALSCSEWTDNQAVRMDYLSLLRTNSKWNGLSKWRRE